MEPDQRVADFAKAGSDIITVHAEQSATIHLHRLIGQVPEPGCHGLCWVALAASEQQLAAGPPFQAAAVHCSRLCRAVLACFVS